MKKLIYSVLVLITALSLTLTSCKKKEDAKPPSIEGKWSITKRETIKGVTTTSETLDCDKVSILDFRSGGVYVFTNACAGNTQQTGTWSYNAESKLLSITTTRDGVTETIILNVVELTATSLVLQISEMIGGDVNVTEKTYLTRK
jgi:YD repeat-containing protein